MLGAKTESLEGDTPSQLNVNNQATANVISTTPLIAKTLNLRLYISWCG
jgi:hypothetical protein